MVEAPERIRVAQDAEGFWTCREAIAGSREYIRADIAERQIAELRAELATVKLAQEANHNLAVANGERAREEHYRAEAAEAENTRLRALPLKDEVERVLDRIADEYGIPGPWDEKFKTAQSLARALLSRLRAGEQGGHWREIETNFQIKGRRRSPAYFPATGEECEVSGPNCDDAAGYTWMTATVLWQDELFVLYGRPGFWPNLHKREHVLFRPLPAAPSDQGGDRG